MPPKDTTGPASSLEHTSLMAKVRARFTSLESAHKTAIIIALLTVLWMVSGVFKSAETVQVENTQTALQHVRVMLSHSEDHVPTIALMGRTEAVQAVDVRTEIPGRVAEIVTEQGAHVEDGQVLVRLDAEDRLQRLAEAKARLKQRQIAYESAAKLSKGGYSSQLSVAQAEADLEAARALVTRVEREIANTTIKAPFAGVVDLVTVDVGDYLDKAGLIAARVLDLTAIKAVGQVTEIDVTKVKEGGLATVRLPDGRQVQGVVSFVGMSSSTLTRTFPIEVTAPVIDNSVPEGLTAEIILPLEPIVGHKISPALLTLDDSGQIGVKTVTDEGVVEFHPVHIATDAVDGAWLTGLADDVRIITVGQEFVRVGEKVETIEGVLPTMQEPQDQAEN